MAVVKESACQYRRHGFNLWVGNIPWRREWQPTSVFLPGESHAQRSLQATVYGIAKSQTQMSNFHLLTLDAASFPWGGNPKSIWFRPPRPSSFKGMKTASPHENAEGPVGLGREEQETCSRNTVINSFSRCGWRAGDSCVVIKLPVAPEISASYSSYLCPHRHRCSNALRLLLHLQICLSYFTFQNDWINKVQSLRKYLLNTS